MSLSRRVALRSFGGLLGLSTLPAAVRAHPRPPSGGGDDADSGTTATAGFAPRGALAVDGARDAVVAGNLVAVAATDGFALVDVSAPANPTLLADRRDVLADRAGGPLGGIYDTAVDGDRLLVAGPAEPPVGDALAGAALYDVSDPVDPTLLRFHETDYPVHNCALRDGVAYLTGNDGERNALVLVDVTADPPAELSRWSVLDANPAWGDVAAGLRVVHDVTVDDGVAALANWDAGTWLLDVSDPREPRPLGHTGDYDPADVDDAGNGELFQLPGNAHYARRRGDLLLVGREAWDLDAADDTEGGPGGIDLYDASDPADVEHLATVSPPATPDPTTGGVWTTAHNFDVVGDRLYASWYQGGVTAVDLSDPSAPAQVAHFRESDRRSFWTAQRADACVVATSWHGPSGDLDAGVSTFPALDDSTETADATDTTGTTSETGAPGFGVGTALAGLGAGAATWWWRGRE